MRAAKVRAVKFLLEKGCDGGIEDSLGKTPHDYAEMAKGRGSEPAAEIAALLEKAGASRLQILRTEVRDNNAGILHNIHIQCPAQEFYNFVY